MQISQSSEQNISAKLTTALFRLSAKSTSIPGFYQCQNLPRSNVFIRDWKTFNIATFSADYKSTDWPNSTQIDKGNPNFSFHNYFEEVEKMISSQVPLRETRKRGLKFLNKPWIIPLVYKSL